MTFLRKQRDFFNFVLKWAHLSINIIVLIFRYRFAVAFNKFKTIKDKYGIYNCGSSEKFVLKIPILRYDNNNYTGKWNITPPKVS